MTRVRKGKDKRGHASHAPGTKQERPGRSNKGRKRITQEAWNEEFQKLLFNAPKELKTLEAKMNWAMVEMQQLYRFKNKRRHH